MKKRILAYLLILTAAVSCYKDLSTEAGEPLPDLVVSGLEPELNVVFGQTINVAVTSVLQTSAGRMIFVKPAPII